MLIIQAILYRRCVYLEKLYNKGNFEIVKCMFSLTCTYCNVNKTGSYANNENSNYTISMKQNQIQFLIARMKQRRVRNHIYNTIHLNFRLQTIHLNLNRSYCWGQKRRLIAKYTISHSNLNLECFLAFCCFTKLSFDLKLEFQMKP